MNDDKISVKIPKEMKAGMWKESARLFGEDGSLSRFVRYMWAQYIKTTKKGGGSDRKTRKP